MQQNTTVLTKPSGDRLKLILEDYQEHFGVCKGTALFNEFTTIVHSELESDKKKDLIYIAIWKLFRCDWVHYIASVQSERSSTHKCVFSTMFDVPADLKRLGINLIFSHRAEACVFGRGWCTGRVFCTDPRYIIFIRIIRLHNTYICVLMRLSFVNSVSLRSQAIMADITETYGIPVNENCLQPGFDWRTGAVMVDMRCTERFIKPRNLRMARSCILNIKSAKKLFGNGVSIPDRLNSYEDAPTQDSWLRIDELFDNSHFSSLSTFVRLQQEFLEFKSTQAKKMEECLETVDMADSDATDLTAGSNSTRRSRPALLLRRSSRHMTRPESYREDNTVHSEGLNSDSDASSRSASNYSLDDEESLGRASPDSSDDAMSS